MPSPQTGEPLRNLRDFLSVLRARGQLCEITAAVDPRLEVAEIHRRVIEARGPALLFRNVKGADFPLVTNLFGTKERVDIAFGDAPKAFLGRVVEAAHTLLPPTLSKLWAFRDLAKPALRVGMRSVPNGPVTRVSETPRLDRLPATTSWHSDGGPFLTLPLVLTHDPETDKPNLGMYRCQIHAPDEMGLHFQIHKGGGFHLHKAESLGRNLPVTVFLGGPPALILSAIAPLPEDVPELLLASLVLGEKLPRVHGRSPHPLVAECEFALVGEAVCGVRKPEGPFGDHYGYNSLRHDYPVMKVKTVFRREDAILPATVVGRPRQEDFFIGDYLQDLLSPLFPLVMPAVKQLFSYGEAGFHCLAGAVVRDRYPREAVASGFRILGEGQLSLQKIVLLTDRDVDLADFRTTWETILARCDWRRDLIVISQTSQDTLDYTGPKVNSGSKAMILGLGEATRPLPERWNEDAALPDGVREARIYCRGCLVVEGRRFSDEAGMAKRIAAFEGFREWPLVVLVDDVREATASTELFLWTTFTRMEPAADIHGRESHLSRFHVGLEPPVVFDCRMKPWYPEVLAVDQPTRDLVDRRWSEYGIPK